VFAERAVGKTNVSSYLRSEALRYQGKYLFAAGKPQEARPVRDWLRASKLEDARIAPTEGTAK
jgi:hypothetical protein